MRKAVALGLALALLSGAALSQVERRVGVLAACRADIETQCGELRGKREKLRACMAENRDKLSPGCRNAIREQRDGPGSGAMPAQTLSYGNDVRQAVDYYPAKSGKAAPLIVFIHGGGWSKGDKRQASGDKPAHFTAAGYAFASVNYRLVPDAKVEEQAADIADAIDTLRYRAADLGFDPQRIALMGHSAGAHLAALVATDPQYLKAAGVPMSAVKAVVLLDGAGYDVPRQMASDGPLLGRIYDAAFGSDAKRQAALSPIRHAAPPNAPNWLALYVSDRDASKQQSEALVAALGKAGAKANAVPIGDTDHGKLNRDLGTAGDAATLAVDDFLRTSL